MQRLEASHRGRAAWSASWIAGEPAGEEAEPTDAEAEIMLAEEGDRGAGRAAAASP